MGPAGVRVANAVVAVPLTWLPNFTATFARLPVSTATKCSKVAAATARIALRRWQILMLLPAPFVSTGLEN